ncbi:peptidyl-prolyl cis-trans isomerase SurA [Rhizomicrobium palustre]|uniref:Parvulin-like PPIase n=1 Tax=Rhizomicrobium palustre TaxID=189966 RepID=A0A846MUI8_9PROT|nr:peptidylprolyl isomerase [Rhizomicrobium palustre]NIK87023.1 peptidyl-prolyl cis-trans isomerase SurA [Rhizomicrobium palustre]
MALKSRTLQIRSLAPVLAALAVLVPGVIAPLGAAPLQREARVDPAAATTPGAAPEKGEAKVPAKPKKPHFQNGIVALVNDTPITSYELQQRMALVMTTSNIPRTPEMEKKVRDQVLEQLETEVLQRAEANKNDITVSAVEVDKYMQEIISENHMSLDQLKEILARGNVQLATFRAQLAAQIQWQKAVNEHFQGRVTISPEAVDAEMARIKEGDNKAHFAVSEIFLAVENPDQDEKVRKDAEGLVTQLKSGGQFTSIARQFSQSPSAAQGGDIGVVFDGQLAPELNKVLATMKTGDMSEPVRSTGGYYILVLRQRFEPEGTKIEDKKPTEAGLPATLPLGRVLLRLPPKAPQDYVTKVLEIGKTIQNAITSCDMAEKTIPKSVPGSLYFALGNVRMADLNEKTREVLGKTESGGVADPFLSDAGIEIFVRCDKREIKQVAWQKPTREQIEQQLFNEQISALARRYNRDLRRNANIETR